MKQQTLTIISVVVATVALAGCQMNQTQQDTLGGAALGAGAGALIGAASGHAGTGAAIGAAAGAVGGSMMSNGKD